jgi:four helix bundle protein
MDRSAQGLTVMTDSNQFTCLPHHRLDAFVVAVDFVRLIRNTPIADANMRKHAQASAGACARNLAEGAGRRSRADKMRAYSVARAELCEAVTAVEIDEALGGCNAEHVIAVRRAGSRLDAMMRSLTREAGT